MKREREGKIRGRGKTPTDNKRERERERERKKEREKGEKERECKHKKTIKRIIRETYTFPLYIPIIYSLCSFDNLFKNPTGRNKLETRR